MVTGTQHLFETLGLNFGCGYILSSLIFLYVVIVCLFVCSDAGDHIHLSPYLSYISGALAGCAATVGSYPFDLLRTLLASQGEPKV